MCREVADFEPAVSLADMSFFSKPGVRPIAGANALSNVKDEVTVWELTCV